MKLRLEKLGPDGSAVWAGDFSDWGSLVASVVTPDVYRAHADKRERLLTLYGRGLEKMAQYRYSEASGGGTV